MNKPQWVQANSSLLSNAASLIGTKRVTSGLGFAYWWFAAQYFSPTQVGGASSEISAMMLLGTICMLGMGTLLMGELPRQKQQRASLIYTALLLVGGTGAVTGLVFAQLAPGFLSGRGTAGGSFGESVLFATGVSLTAIALVLDQAVVGLLRGSWQLWRNGCFALSKLILLSVLGYALVFARSEQIIYVTWVIGTGLSLIPFVIWQVRHWQTCQPQWRLLRQLGWSAIQNHLLNLAIQTPGFVLPLIVTVWLSPQMNAFFYVCWMIAYLVFVISLSLSNVMASVCSAKPEELPHKLRLSLGVTFLISLVAILFLWICAPWLLGFFGDDYVQPGTECLRLLSLTALPLIIKSHAVAVYRVQRQINRALFLLLPGLIVELSAAICGAMLANLPGVVIGWMVVLIGESILLLPLLWRSARGHVALFEEQVKVVV